MAKAQKPASDVEAFIVAARAAAVELRVNRRVPFTPAVGQFVDLVVAMEQAEEAERNAAAQKSE